jgi:transcriptional regulator with XRE-family HTH domain
MEIPDGEEAEAAVLRQVGQRLQANRKAAGLTQGQVAGRLGMTRSSVANMEAGRQVISVFHLAVMAAAFGVDPADLLGVRREDVAGDWAHKVTIKLTCEVACAACGTFGLEMSRSAEEPGGCRRTHAAAARVFAERAIGQLA